MIIEVMPQCNRKSANHTQFTRWRGIFDTLSRSISPMTDRLPVTLAETAIRARSSREDIKK